MAERSNKDSEKSPVKIRFKAMKDGRRSIYLDCYRDGHRTYEYLKLYLVPETDDESLRRNEVAMRKAEIACRRKLRELKNYLSGASGLWRRKAAFRRKTYPCWSGFPASRRYSEVVVFMTFIP